MNGESLVQLKDIQGLDTIPWWPLATGWWLVAVFGVLVIMLVVYQIRSLLRYPAGSWRRQAWRQLRTLRRQSDRMAAERIASELSELLRRIAIARLGREQAAGLSGENWLAWLRANDPAGFDWMRHGKPLLSLPYAPAGACKVSGEQLLPLIDAAAAWVERRGEAVHV